MAERDLSMTDTQNWEDHVAVAGEELVQAVCAYAESKEDAMQGLAASVKDMVALIDRVYAGSGA